MITLKKLSFDNLFSYGRGNYICFNKDPITQLVGRNGHGKTSIPLILEEAIYNKNSKGIKKADILNRYIKDKSYSINLTFTKDGNEYEISTTRGSTQVVKLLKDGVDISAHTATATFKMIESIFGLDNKAFSQLIYQSSSSSLEFLTATDSNRKKFLIDLLNLDKYVEAFEVFKAAVKEVSEEVSSIETSIKTTQSWIDRNSKVPLSYIELKELPTIDPKVQQDLTDTKAQLQGVEYSNKQITKNNQYKANLKSIDVSSIKDAVPPIDNSHIVKHSGELSKTIKDATAFISKIAHLDGTCPTCLQLINRQKLEELINDQEVIKATAQEALNKINKELAEHRETKLRYEEAQRLKSEYEQYHSLIDDSLPEKIIDSEDLLGTIKDLESKLDTLYKEIKEIESFNKTASANNSKISVISEQMASMEEDLVKYNESLAIVGEKLSYLQILQKTFSTSGLIAYKIECLVKDLEDLANKYLAELSDGRFQLTFKVTASDKLNIIITDNGVDIDIVALSGGEKARVNTATLLAIRKLMQSLSNARINLLVLDETIDSLDTDGKEKLVEVLLKEEHLNTFLISHGFTHPLLEKITVIKENNISRLE